MQNLGTSCQVIWRGTRSTFVPCHCLVHWRGKQNNTKAIPGTISYFPTMTNLFLDKISGDWSFICSGGGTFPWQISHTCFGGTVWEVKRFECYLLLPCLLFVLAITNKLVAHGDIVAAPPPILTNKIYKQIDCLINFECPLESEQFFLGSQKGCQPLQVTRCKKWGWPKSTVFAIRWLFSIAISLDMDNLH